tara:strand:- start:143 stop:649 length:507 start_codon:yes stop_codon:yes gene_type:complete
MFRLSKFKKTKHKNGSIIKRILWYAFSPIFFENKIPIPQILKKIVLVIFGAKIGQGVVIKPSVQIKYPWNLIIHNHVWIGEKCWLDNLDIIEIKNNVCISQGSMLETGSHDFKSEGFELITYPITINSNTWIGCRCLILPGANIERGSIFYGGSIIGRHSRANKLINT